VRLPLVALAALVLAPAALVLAPAAAAWTSISTTPLQNIDHAAVLRTSAGTELVADFTQDSTFGIDVYHSPTRRSCPG
jgi:hypothetical protein